MRACAQLFDSFAAGSSPLLTPHASQYLTHHYLIDLVAGGSLTCIFFYYYLSKMPDELRHPTLRPQPAPYRASTPLLGGAIPLDEESGLPKTFAHSAAGANGKGYGQGERERDRERWEDSQRSSSPDADDLGDRKIYTDRRADGGETGEEAGLADEARLYDAGAAALRASETSPARARSPLLRRE